MTSHLGQIVFLKMCYFYVVTPDGVVAYNSILCLSEAKNNLVSSNTGFDLGNSHPFGSWFLRDNLMEKEIVVTLTSVDAQCVTCIVSPLCR